MKFPDLLIKVQQMEQRLRLLTLDVNQLHVDLARVFPEAEQYIGRRRSTVDSTVDSPKETPDAPTLF